MMRFSKLFGLIVALLAIVPPTRAADQGVTVTEDNATYTLANDHISARVSKRNGDLVSLKFKDLELLGAGSGHPGGYWSHAPAGQRSKRAITIDPKSNNGDRAEIAVKSISGGTPQGQGPGGSAITDLEIRYALGRADSGVYTYSIFTHQSDYPATSIGEARFGAKLNANVFDWMTIDANRNRQMPTPDDWDKGTPLNMKEVRRLTTGLYAGQAEHKYDYSAIQFEIPAFGWSSTTKNVGLWFVNPTIEYLSGGATKVELTGHLDVNAGAAPTLLNYWRGSHYGASRCDIAPGESWTKVIGPFLIYCNAGATPADMWKDALSQAQRESAAWPYDWVSGVDYPHKAERAMVSGQITLKDPAAPNAKLNRMLVGLTAPDYTATGGRRGGQASVDWQQDAKYYQFWVRADEDGRFAITNVRPGKYTLHAIAQNVLGEYARVEITVALGKSVDLGTLEWTPARFGKQLWEIGTPNRSAEEFRHGDHYWQWGLYNEYPKDFPDDVNFVIGKSDPRKDWNYAQCPRADRPNGTPWSISFELDHAPKGKATLRVAFAATSARSIAVTVNDQPAGSFTGLPDTATIRRDGIRGYWYERTLPFDAALLKAGTNVLKLTIPPGNAMSGVEYDYLRLELDEIANPPAAP